VYSLCSETLAPNSENERILAMTTQQNVTSAWRAVHEAGGPAFDLEFQSALPFEV
jgi:hypothetical protein